MKNSKLEVRGVRVTFMNMLKPVLRRSVSPPDICSTSGHSRLSGWKISSSTCLSNGLYVACTQQQHKQQQKTAYCMCQIKCLDKHKKKTLIRKACSPPHKHFSCTLQRMLISNWPISMQKAQYLFSKKKIQIKENPKRYIFTTVSDVQYERIMRKKCSWAYKHNSKWQTRRHLKQPC